MLRNVVGETACELLAAFVELAPGLLMNEERGHEADGEDDRDGNEAKSLA